jgi:hypothetical protein
MEETAFFNLNYLFYIFLPFQMLDWFRIRASKCQSAAVSADSVVDSGRCSMHDSFGLEGPGIDEF